MPNAAKSCNWFKRHKILTGVLALIVIIAIAAGASGGNKTKTTPQTTSGTKTAKTAAAEAGKVSQSAAENYCQDAGLLDKYIDTKTTAIVTTSYNPQYVDSGMKASNGNEIWDLQWSGKNKSTGESIGFVCLVSGTDKSITLHSLAINGTAVYGPVDEQ